MFKEYIFTPRAAAAAAYGASFRIGEAGITRPLLEIDGIDSILGYMVRGRFPFPGCKINILTDKNNRVPRFF